MDFFGVGPLEIIVVASLALIVVGPRKLPDLGRQMGRFIQQFRKATSDLTREFKDEFQDINEAVTEFKAEVTEFKADVGGITADVRETLTVDLNEDANKSSKSTSAASLPERATTSASAPTSATAATAAPVAESSPDGPSDLGPFARTDDKDAAGSSPPKANGSTPSE